MTSRERLLTAYRCEQPDGLPIMISGVRCWDEQWSPPGIIRTSR